MAQVNLHSPSNPQAPSSFGTVTGAGCRQMLAPKAGDSVCTDPRRPRSRTGVPALHEKRFGHSRASRKPPVHRCGWKRKSQQARNFPVFRDPNSGIPEKMLAMLHRPFGLRAFLDPTGRSRSERETHPLHRRGHYQILPAASGMIAVQDPMPPVH